PITFDSGTRVFTVLGTHNYATVSTFTITVTVHHLTATDTVITATASVAIPGATVTGGRNITAAEGSTSSVQTVATFVDPNGAGSATYSADIDWGDGNTSTGTITANGATFTVAGSHKYTEEGSFSVVTTVHRAGSSDGVGTSTATISDVSVIGTGGFTYTAPVGVAGSTQTLASFTDPAGAEAVNEYLATINWGDGSSSAGTIT